MTDAELAEIEVKLRLGGYDAQMAGVLYQQAVSLLVDVKALRDEVEQLRRQRIYLQAQLDVLQALNQELRGGG